MASTSLAQARAFIDELRKKNGGLTQEQRLRLRQEFPDALNVIDNLRRQLGASTKTLAANLYAKDTRFVYELIQNAEDNSYEIADLLSKSPSLEFALYHDRIVIDSNEDGFTEQNIKAICSIGESTKSHVQGYIGEKGIGFKSVFKVAHKVHVQSALYSFAFEYDSAGNDNGLGMVTPINEQHRDVPGEVRTRIILYLSETCKRSALAKEFASLPDTLLLFLKKLKALTILIDLPTHPKVHHSYSLSKSNRRVRIHKHCHITNTISKQKYWVARRVVTDMPNERARKGIKEAEIVLAFPLDANDSPIIEDQHTFAFLPLRKAGYKFLIQSDFITQASREDVFDSDWNNRLLEDTSKLFLDTVSKFLKHSSLKHTWVRFVPAARIADEFWGKLQIRIFRALQTRKVFFGINSTSLWAPSDLRLVSDKYRDSEGVPLLSDTDNGATAYVSEIYHQEKDISIIQMLGMKSLSTFDFIVRLEQDLTAKHSQMRSKPPQSEWHTKVANLLTKAIDEDRQVLQTIEMLPIIPLTTDLWVRPRKASLFLPTCRGAKIPTDLRLSLVDGDSLLNKSRAILFTRLGVKECQLSQIFPLIQQRYELQLSTVKVQQSVAHILFIFWNHSELPEDGISIRLASANGNTWFNPNDNATWTYCSRYTATYSMSKLLGASIPEQLKGKINFPNPLYYEVLEKSDRRNDRLGIEWFRDFALLKKATQLQARNSKIKKSPEFDYIIDHSPHRLLGVLQANWHQYQDSVLWNTSIEFVEVLVLDSDDPEELVETFLPLPRLKTIADRLGLHGFGFLKELDGIVDNEASKWLFLEQFGVGADTDVWFWLKALKHVASCYELKATKDDVVFEIYSQLQLFSGPKETIIIRTAFDSFLIFDPSTEAEETWASPGACLWDAPEWFSYPDVLCLGRIAQYRMLSSLFTVTLEIRNVEYQDYLQYLTYMRGPVGTAPLAVDGPRIPLIYQELENAGGEDAARTDIRSQFEEHRLLYHPGTLSWHRPSSCVWAEDKIQLPGKISIATVYDGKKTFFTKILGVPKPTLDDHILALKAKCATNPSKEDVMLEMLNICAYNPQAEALKELLDCKCLPIVHADGTLGWVDRSKAFSIVDRREYAELFDGKLTLLAFTLEEVHPLGAFLHGLGLAERYMSTAVEEESQKPDGSLHQRLTDDLRNKSYAICRYAAHFGLKNLPFGPLDMFEILRTMHVYVSDNIFKAVSIEQNGSTVTVQQDTAYLHIEETDDQFSIYVPRSKRRRQVCLSRQLPIELLSYFDVTNSLRGTELGSIIIAPDLFTVDELLRFAGIIEVPGIVRPEIEEFSDDESCVSEDETLVADAVPIMEPQAPQHTAQYFPQHSRANETNNNAQFVVPDIVTPPTTIFDELPNPPETTGLYKQLLEAVIAQAESINLLDLPGKGSHTVVAMSTSLGLDTSLAVSSSVGMEREFKIGAAGELFMFHFLKKAGLSNFDETCWQSTIRHRVAVHEEYRELSRWSGQETADIVYKDQGRFLTNILIVKGYLNALAWQGISPTYFIEVKTTPGSLETPFFCSQGQVDRMAKLQIYTAGVFGLGGTANAHEIYLIARVFSLGDSGIGFKLYLDPETLRKSGELQFKADKYVVTPTR